MKVDELAAAVKDMLLADKLIHEQHLGWKWLPPSKDIFLVEERAKNGPDKINERGSSTQLVSESGTTFCESPKPENEVLQRET